MPLSHVTLCQDNFQGRRGRTSNLLCFWELMVKAEESPGAPRSRQKDMGLLLAPVRPLSPSLLPAPGQSSASSFLSLQPLLHAVTPTLSRLLTPFVPVMSPVLQRVTMRRETSVTDLSVSLEARRGTLDLAATERTSPGSDSWAQWLDLTAAGRAAPVPSGAASHSLP